MLVSVRALTLSGCRLSVFGWILAVNITKGEELLLESKKKLLPRNPESPTPGILASVSECSHFHLKWCFPQGFCVGEAGFLGECLDELADDDEGFFG